MTRKIYSAGLVFALFFTGAARADDSRGLLKTACLDDYKKYCSGVMPGGGRIKRCMDANARSLSHACRDALKAYEAKKASDQKSSDNASH